MTPTPYTAISPPPPHSPASTRPLTHPPTHTLSLPQKTHAHRRYEDDVPDEVKHRRLEEVIKAFRDGAAESNAGLMGTVQHVLVDGVCGVFLPFASSVSCPALSLSPSLALSSFSLFFSLRVCHALCLFGHLRR